MTNEYKLVTHLRPTERLDWSYFRQQTEIHVTVSSVCVKCDIPALPGLIQSDIQHKSTVNICTAARSLRQRDVSGHHKNTYNGVIRICEGTIYALLTESVC